MLGIWNLSLPGASFPVWDSIWLSEPQLDTGKSRMFLISAFISKQASFVMKKVVVLTASSVIIMLCYLVWRVHSGKHNVLITCARPHSQENGVSSVMCVIARLFILTLLHFFHSVTENGGSILWQHHWTAEDWTGVLSNGLLWQEVSFLPQGRTFQIQSDTDIILPMCSDVHFHHCFNCSRLCKMRS